MRLKSEFAVSQLVRLAKVSRAGYYKWLHSQEKRGADQKLLLELQEHILAIHRQHLYYGYKRIRTALRRVGILVNH